MWRRCWPGRQGLKMQSSRGIGARRGCARMTQASPIAAKRTRPWTRTSASCTRPERCCESCEWSDALPSRIKLQDALHRRHPLFIPTRPARLAQRLVDVLESRLDVRHAVTEGGVHGGQGDRVSPVVIERDAVGLVGDLMVPAARPVPFLTGAPRCQTARSYTKRVSPGSWSITSIPSQASLRRGMRVSSTSRTSRTSSEVRWSGKRRRQGVTSGGKSHHRLRPAMLVDQE